MKKLVKYILIFSGLVSLASCKDFWDTDSESSLSSEKIYANENLTEQAVLGIYDIIGEDKSYRNRLAGSYAGYSTDIEKSTKLGDYSTTWTNSDVGNRYDGKDCWGWLFKGVERANLCINGIETYSDTTKAKFSYLLAEALTMRAFLYNDIVKLWGDVPYRFDPMTDENKYSPKVDRALIYQKLLNDLKRAETLLGSRWADGNPTSAKSTVERVNLAFVKGLRARIALMYAGYALRPDNLVQGGSNSYKVQLNTQDASKRKALYQIAVDECADVIGHYQLTKLKSHYEDIFKEQCSDVVSFSSSESLFELPFSEARGQIVNLCGLKVNNSTADVRGHLIHCPSGHSTSGNITVLPGFYYKFDKNDTRRDVTASVAYWNYTKANASDVPSAIYSAAGAKDTTYILWKKVQDASKISLAKWRFEWMGRDPGTSSDDGVNFCVMRYADVLLMYAEAAIGGITGDVPDVAAAQTTAGMSAQAAFDAVRSRAGLTTSTWDGTMGPIEDERAFEFCGEQIRKYDLMRWGLLKTNMDQAVNNIISIVSGSATSFTLNGNTYPCKIYIQYAKSTENYSSDGTLAFVINDIYGINPGETDGTSSTYPSSNGWKNKSFSSNYLGSGSSGYVYYNYNRTNNDASAVAANPDLRQLWPIFQSNINSSNGTLWNDYGY